MNLLTAGKPTALIAALVEGVSTADEVWSFRI